jgi:hypothetical protein
MYSTLLGNPSDLKNMTLFMVISNRSRETMIIRLLGDYVSRLVSVPR